MTELILTLHLLFILFLVAGFPLGLHFNGRRFRLIHAGLLAGVSILMILGIPCPLTVLEEEASGGSYGGSFAAFWLRRIVYLTWIDPAAVFWLDMGFAVLVFSSFAWRPMKKR